MSEGDAPAARGAAAPPPPRYRRVLGRLLPWLVGIGILAAVAANVPYGELVASLALGPKLGLAAYIAALVVPILTADGFATRAAFAVAGEPRPLAAVVLARGATYLLGLLSYALGQAAMGLYLFRSGTRASRASGVLLFTLTANVGALATIATVGVVSESGGPTRDSLAPWLWVVLAGVALYLAVIASRFDLLARRELLKPLFEAGVGGYLRALLARLPHHAAVVLALWGGLRIWGIPVPLGRGLLLIPVVLLVATLPITPSGLGSTQAAMVLLFSPYVAAADPGARTATVFAFGLLYNLFGLAAQSLVGVACLAALPDRKAAAEGATDGPG